VLALLLIGIARFGMGLLNLQGQVQGVVIGLLLILSILLPFLGARLPSRPALDRGLLLRACAALLVAGAFGWLFFWSRAAALALK
jgi:hypothetical protein